jgi:hypothetical protein
LQKSGSAPPHYVLYRSAKNSLTRECFYASQYKNNAERTRSEANERKITMKTLMFITAMSVLSATGAFAQGVDFSLGAPGVPPVTYTDGSGVVLSSQGQPAPQQFRQHRYRMMTQHFGGYTKIARKKVW